MSVELKMSIFELEFDPKIENQANKVFNEPHVVEADKTALFVTLKGNYFLDTLVVKNSLGVELTYPDDYSEYVIDQEMTRVCDGIVAAGVVIKLPSPAGNYTIDAHMVGGQGGVTPALYNALLVQIAASSSSAINFNDLNLPANFIPGPHTHSLLHMSENQLLQQKVTDLISAFNGIHTTGLAGNELSRTQKHITNMIISLRNSINRLSAGGGTDLSQSVEFNDLVTAVDEIALSITTVTEQMNRIETKVDQDHDTNVLFMKDMTTMFTNAETNLSVTPYVPE